MKSDNETEKTVDILNSALRSEISAVETYEHAMAKTKDSPIPEFRENRDCHEDRQAVLRQRITELGGTPDTSSGMWGEFAYLIEGGAALFGRSACIASLEEGEDRSLAEYRRAIQYVDESTRMIIEKDLLPAEERTHRRMSELKHRPDLRAHQGKASTS